MFTRSNPSANGLFRVVFLVLLLLVSIGSVMDFGSTPAAALNDKLQHILAFAALGGLGGAGWPLRHRWAFVLPLLLGYGLLIECVQWFLPWREFSMLDLAADLVGLLLALGALEWRVRGRAESGA